MPQLSKEILELVEPLSKKWLSLSHFDERDLLRLAVLRDLAHLLHAEKSRCLFRGDQTFASDLRSTETQVEELRKHRPFAEKLTELLEKQFQLSSSTAQLQEAVFQKIPREKLLRYDRQWEAELLAEALQVGWNLWKLESAVKISQVNGWSQELVEQLWPHGIVLFAESASEMDAERLHWNGRWFCVLSSKVTDLAPLSPRFSAGPQSHSPLSWQLLFSQKTPVQG